MTPQAEAIPQEFRSDLANHWLREAVIAGGALNLARHELAYHDAASNMLNRHHSGSQHRDAASVASHRVQLAEATLRCACQAIATHGSPLTADKALATLTDTPWIHALNGAIQGGEHAAQILDEADAALLERGFRLYRGEGGPARVMDEHTVEVGCFDEPPVMEGAPL